MQRREMLLTTGAAVLGLSAFPLGWVAAEDKRKPRILYFTKSAGWVHSVVDRRGQPLAHSERSSSSWAGRMALKSNAVRMAAVFDGDLGKYDLLAFYTSGNPFEKKQMQNVLRCRVGRQAVCWLPCGERFGRLPGHQSVPLHDRRKLCHARRPAESQDESHFADISGRARPRRWLRVGGRVVCA